MCFRHKWYNQNYHKCPHLKKITLEGGLSLILHKMLLLLWMHWSRCYWIFWGISGHLLSRVSSVVWLWLPWCSELLHRAFLLWSFWLKGGKRRMMQTQWTRRMRGHSQGFLGGHCWPQSLCFSPHLVKTLMEDKLPELLEKVARSETQESLKWGEVLKGGLMAMCLLYPLLIFMHLKKLYNYHKF